MIKNIRTNTEPCFLHWPGRHRDWKIDVINNLIMSKSVHSETPENLDIITFNTKQEKGLLEKNLDHWGVKHIVFGRGEEWKNNNGMSGCGEKIGHICNHLENTTAEYVMGLDCYDVLMVKKLDRIIEKFQKYKCELLFNAEPNCFPAYSDRGEIERSICPRTLGNWCFLNAGMWIGKRDFCIDFFSKAKKINCTDEQVVLKSIYLKMHPLVKIDYMQEIFRVMIYVSIAKHPTIKPHFLKI